MVKLSKKDVLLLHNLVITSTGGICGVRDETLLDSAINCPFQTFSGQDLYNSVEEKAAMLGYSIICNHPFIDGNKRVGILSMLTFLEVNNVELNYSDEELIKIGFNVADKKMSYDDILRFIISHKIIKNLNDVFEDLPI